MTTSIKSIEDKFNAMEAVDLKSYSDRWEAIWAAGLQPGQVRGVKHRDEWIMDDITHGIPPDTVTELA